MDVITVAKEIENRIQMLSLGRTKLVALSEEKAKKSADYEKAIAKTIMKLKNGESISLDGETIQNPPASVLDKLSKGICWEEGMAKDMAEGAYKAAIVIMSTIESELNGWQSINRYLKEGV